MMTPQRSSREGIQVALETGAWRQLNDALLSAKIEALEMLKQKIEQEISELRSKLSGFQS